MATETDFHSMVGRTIMYCQCIENDIKLIYAGMLVGDLETNYQSIKKNSLGTIVAKLQTLDNSDSKPYFGNGDYELLRDITKIRNYWAHQGYLDYVYDLNNFNNQYHKLCSDSRRLEKLHRTTQDIRLEYFGYEPEEND